MTARTVAQKKISQSRNLASPKGPRGRPRQFSREEGLRKAMRLFWARGYEATSMADLRAGLGITQASLYAAYQSKEALFREAVQLYLRTDGITTTRALSQPGAARDAIQAMLQDAVDAFTAHGAPGGCLIVLAATNCTVDNKAVQQHLAELRQETLHSISRRLKQAQQQGELSKNVLVKELASYFTTVLHGLSLAARDGASRKQLTSTVNLALKAWPQADDHVCA